MRRKFNGGLTSLSLPVVVYDTTSTTGVGLSGLTHSTSGLVLEYRRAGQSSWTSVTLVSKTLGTYVSGGIVASGSRAGRYEVDIPDAAISAGARMIEICLRGAANMHPVDIEIELDAVDYQDATAFGLSRIDQTIGSRATQTSVDTLAGYVDTEVAAIKAKTDNLPSDPADASDIATSFGTVNSTLSTIASYVDTEVAAIKAKTDLIAAFPANFNLLGIGATGEILTVQEVAELGASALTANGVIDTIPTAVWNALTTTTYTNLSFGDRILISTNNNREVAVTGSSHVAAVLHDAEPNSIPEDAFQSGAVSARVIATDAIDGDALAASANTEIANAVGTLQVLTQLSSMIEADGAGWQYTASSLDQAPAGGGGGGTDWTANERTAIRAILGVPTSGTTPTDPTTGILDTIRDSVGAIGINVYPVSASTPERVAGTTITYYRNEIRTVSVVTDFTLTSLTLTFTVEDSEGTDLLTIANASISRSDKTFTVSIGTAVTATISNYRWALRDITGGTNSVIARGVLTVQEAASA